MEEDSVTLRNDEKVLLSPSASSLTSGTCRLCNQTSPVTSLLRPCPCTSPSPFVHRACLDSWRAFNLDGRSFSHCSTCGFAYRFSPVQDSSTAMLDRSLQWQSHTSKFLSWMAIAGLSSLLFLAIFVNACDLSNHIPPSFPSLSPLMAYLIVALLLLLLLLNLWGILAFSYGLHLPITYRANYHTHPADYAITQRLHFVFCFHPDLFCYAPYGLQFEYTMISSTHQPWADAALLVLMVAATWLVGLFFGCLVGVYVLYRTGGRYIEKLRLQELTKKYVVRDVWEGGDEEVDKGKVEEEVVGDGELIPALPSARLSAFVDGMGGLGGAGVEGVREEGGEVRGNGEGGEGGVDGDESIGQWHWRVVVEDEKGEREEVELEEQEEEVREEEAAESGHLRDWLDEDDEEEHASLSEWLGGDGSVEEDDDSELESRHERAIV